MTVKEFIDEILERLKAEGMSPADTRLAIKVPGRTDGYMAELYDLHPKPEYNKGPLLIINPHTPD
jgi:hypothetical protein